MLNERIIRDYSMTLYIEELNKIHKSKAIFNINDKKTSIILIQLFDNKKEKNIINLTDSNVVGRIDKPDETNCTVLCNVLDKDNGVLAVGLNNAAINVLGECLLTLEVVSGDQTLVLPQISYTVTGKLFEDNVGDSEKLPVLNALIARNTELEKKLLLLTKEVEDKLNKIDILLEKLGGENKVE